MYHIQKIQEYEKYGKRKQIISLLSKEVYKGKYKNTKLSIF